MREISIKILEHKPGLLRVTTFYGDEKEASAAENLFANQLVPLIAESLRIAMPQCITGQGAGNSIEEAQAKCDLETDAFIRKAGESS
jgi:hypothetical protein